MMSTVTAETTPVSHRDDRDRDHARHEDRTDAIGQSLDRRPTALGVADEFRDAGDGRVPSRDRRLDDQSAGRVHRARDHRIARAPRHRQRLTGHERLVDVARAFANRAVDRDASAGPDLHAVAPVQIGARDGADRAIGGDDLGLVGLEFEQFPHRGAGAGGGGGLDPVTQTDETEERGALGEVERTVEPRSGIGRDPLHEHDDAAPRERGGRAEGDERVHVRGATPRRRPRRGVEPAARDREHDRRAHEHDPRHPRVARVAERPVQRLERQPEPEPDDRPVPPPADRRGLPTLDVGPDRRDVESGGDRSPREAAAGDRLEHRRLGDPTRDRRESAGVVDRRRGHPRHPRERLLQARRAAGAVHPVDLIAGGIVGRA